MAATRWVGVLLTDEDSASFSPAGQRLHGDAEVVENELVYVVETDAGHLETLKPSEFLRRSAIAPTSGIDDPDNRATQ